MRCSGACRPERKRAMTRAEGEQLDRVIAAMSFEDRDRLCQEVIQRTDEDALLTSAKLLFGPGGGLCEWEEINEEQLHYDHPVVDVSTNSDTRRQMYCIGCGVVYSYGTF